MSSSQVVFALGLEEGPDGATLVHSLSVPGCVSAGRSREQALERFPAVLAEWLDALAARGVPVPPPDAEIELAVDEWIASGADVAAGESTVCFEHDRRPIGAPEVSLLIQRLGDLRGMLLERLREVGEEGLDRGHAGRPTARRTLAELARAQWWTLSRLGASPLAEVPESTLGQLDTAIALVVQQLTAPPESAAAVPLEVDGEEWTPRKVIRRLLWLEWTLGRAALDALEAETAGSA